MYSLIGAAKLNDLDPKHICTTIECIGAHPVNRVTELLPWNVADALNSRSALELAA